ncbi:MAG TPA: DUF3347 domain-containing protein [Bacteroidia bacterium]|jgi:hypothetical protein|nr:DUF3347 domain-containing protein [Bacteroidia bacterium]
MKNIKKIFAVIVTTLAFQLANSQTVIPIDSIPVSFKTSLNTMMDGYLKIENALMTGNTTDAGKYADELRVTTLAVSTAGLSKKQIAIFNKQVRKIVHNTEHIRDNASDYDHECEHFDLVTDSFYKLLKAFHFNSTAIYYNYTAEGNAGNSAHWLTDKSTMENPYFKGAKKSIGDKQIEVFAARS